MVIYPGGSGSRRPSMRGLDAIAAFFWMRGFSCYIGEVEGQDGRSGEFSIARAVNESRETLNYLRNLLSPQSICLFGSCSGGTVATWLASEPSQADFLVLYETLPWYSDDNKNTFVARAPTSGIQLSPNFIDEYLDTADASPRVTCPVLLLHGDTCTPPVVTIDDMNQLAASFTSASKLEMSLVKGADHNVTRGSALTPLNDLLQVVESFIDRVQLL